ncbi:MAG: DUF427 domain-containing protein [Pseudomonadota bacterium]
MKPIENVGDYPRPPALERFTGSLSITFGGVVICQSKNAWRVLETYHPPTYYIPPNDFGHDVLKPAPGNSMCEWKGQAKYFDIAVDSHRAQRAAWAYPTPTKRFEQIAGFVAVYAEPMDACYVAGEKVQAQPGNFYGGWVNSWITGPIKGRPGTLGW